MIGLPGGPELVLILLIAVLLFGSSKIPKMARSVGEAKGELQKGLEESRQELEQEIEQQKVEQSQEVETTGDTEWPE